MKWAVDEYRDRLIRHLDGSLDGRGWAVDVGAGDLSFTKLLGERGWRALAVDLHPPTASERGGVEVVRADAEHLPFRPGTVRLGFAKDMLHHTGRPERALAELRRAVAPGGRAVVLESNRYNPLAYIHLTLLGGHNHFTRRRFASLVRGAFPESRLSMLSAHVYPRVAGRRFFQAWERTMDRLPLLRRLRSYNVAVAEVRGP